MDALAITFRMDRRVDRIITPLAIRQAEVLVRGHIDRLLVNSPYSNLEIRGKVMPYKPLEIDRTNMTIMGISFPDLKTLERVSNALGSNMFEGFNDYRKLDAADSQPRQPYRYENQLFPPHNPRKAAGRRGFARRCYAE
jgi:hypothetical protein